MCCKICNEFGWHVPHVASYVASYDYQDKIVPYLGSTDQIHHIVRTRLVKCIPLVSLMYLDSHREGDSCREGDSGVLPVQDHN